MKGMFDNNFRGTIFDISTRMEEPSGTETKAVWASRDLHSQVKDQFTGQVIGREREKDSSNCLRVNLNVKPFTIICLQF